ncbi:transposase (plasmid) [Rhizobium sp. YTUHZ045]
MFKILVLQALYNLSDNQAEFVIQDRLSFMRVLGLSLSEKVPDAKTIWLFRDNLVRAGAIDNLFAPLRQASVAVRLPGQGRSDRWCNDHPGPQAAQ